MERTVMWFRRDLRLDDHPALAAACADGEVVPLFVVDPVFAGAGGPRLAYLHDVLTALDSSLRERVGARLVIRHGDPVQVVPEFVADVNATSVTVSRDYTPYGRRRDAAVGDVLTADGPALRGIGSPYAVAPGGVRKDDGTPYAVYTPFSKRWRRTGWPAPVDVPLDDARWPAVDSEPLFDRPEPGCELPTAGERAALDRWESFRHGDGSGVAAYDDRRNLPAVDGTSRLSPDLKWGTIHPRTILGDLDASGAGERGETVFSSEIAWRDFYADVLFQRPDSAWQNLDRTMDALPVDTDRAARARFDRWCRGETGFGIVDAGLRQLAATGWMHNRVRMITASFLVKDLHLPWQWGARWFLDRLVDGDLASNNHGWQWAAGTGTDASPYYRVFNPTTQQGRFDPDGAYVERWVPDPVAPMLDHAAERVEALRRLDVQRAARSAG